MQRHRVLGKHRGGEVTLAARPEHPLMADPGYTVETHRRQLTAPERQSKPEGRVWPVGQPAGVGGHRLVVGPKPYVDVSVRCAQSSDSASCHTVNSAR